MFVWSALGFESANLVVFNPVSLSVKCTKEFTSEVSRGNIDKPEGEGECVCVWERERQRGGERERER